MVVLFEDFIFAIRQKAGNSSKPWRLLVLLAVQKYKESNLLNQRQFPCQRLTRAIHAVCGEAVDVHAGGEEFSAEACRMAARPHLFIDQGGNLSSCDIKHVQMYLTLTGKVIGDLRGRIERGRVVLIQHHLSGDFVLRRSGWWRDHKPIGLSDRCVY